MLLGVNTNYYSQFRYSLTLREPQKWLKPKNCESNGNVGSIFQNTTPAFTFSN